MSVDYVTCGGLLRHAHCVAMEEVGFDVDAGVAAREAICGTCQQRAGALSKRLDLPLSSLTSYAHPSDEAWVKTMSAGVTPDSWSEFEVDGIPLGRYASYEFLLKYKINNWAIPEELWGVYVGQLQNALRAYRACERLLDDMRPDRAIAYNTLYSVNRVFMALAHRQNIPCFTVQGGNHPTYRGETLTIFENDQEVFRAPRSHAWHEWKSQPIGASEVQLVIDAVRAQFEATSPFVYSSPYKAIPPAEMRAHFGIRDQSKVAVVILSSRDELFAADVIGRFERPIDGTFLFEQQSDWVEHLIEIALRRPDLHFVIRVHPREFPNKREAVLSPNALRLQSILADPPQNVSVDWPNSGRSLHNVLQIADVALSGWSSVGCDASMLGIPTVVYRTGDVLAYPIELVNLVDSVEDYELELDRAMGEGWSAERARQAFRWLAFNYGRLSVDLSDQIPSRSRWSARRITQGIYAHTRVPLPFGVVHAFERREIPSADSGLIADRVIADVITNQRGSVAASSAWLERPLTSPEDEERLIAGALLDVAGLLSTFPEDPQCLSSHIENYASEVLSGY